MPRLVDLSQEIYQGMGVYPGHLKTVIWRAREPRRDARSCFEGGFSFQSQRADDVRPRPDARGRAQPPRPARRCAPSIDEMPLDTFYGPAICLDVCHVEAPDYVTVADLEAALERTGLQLNAGDALLLRTGAHDRYGGTPEYTSRYPGLDDGAAAWLRDRGVKVFGVDSPSPDNPISRTYPVHMMCRAKRYHALREPGQPRRRRGTPLHVHRLPAEDPRRHRLARSAPSRSWRTECTAIRAPSPVVITCALTGGIHGKEANPNLPEQPDEIVEQGIAAWRAGRGDPARARAQPGRLEHDGPGDLRRAARAPVRGDRRGRPAHDRRQPAAAASRSGSTRSAWRPRCAR